MSAPEPRCYAFGCFHLDPLRGRLTNGGAAIELRPKAVAVLHYLVAHPHRLVGKDELLAAVWSKVVVTEDSLVQCVRDIRRALGDAEQRLVRTIPRGGYMFVGDATPQPPLTLDAQPPLPPAPPTQSEPAARPVPRLREKYLVAGVLAVLVAATVVALVAVDRGNAPPAAGQGVAAPALSIVVLPLLNIDGAAEHEYFAHGLTQDLTTDLGRLPTGLVISPNSARSYRGRQVDGAQAARELGVRYALEGSVQRLRDDVRVNLRLIDAASGAQRWAERFEGPRAELPQLQASIVRRIGQTLQVRLLEAEAERSLRERSRHPGAQDLLMQGWARWEQRRAADNAAARELFSRALAADAKSSLAWVGVANTHLADLHSGWREDRRVSLEQARQAIEHAHEIGPLHRDVNAGRGYVEFFEGDIESALVAFDQEIETNPGHALAHVWRGLMLISLGRPAEALPSIERAIVLSPRDVDLNVFYRSMAHAYLSLGRFGEATQWSRKSVAQTPAYAKGYALLAVAAALDGDAATAAGAIDSFRRLQPRYGSVAAFRQSMMPGETRMFDATPRFWDGLAKAGLPMGAQH